jgi:transposase
MEACAGAHHMARHLISFGHKVKLISPQFVRPFVKGNQNDFIDAEAICEADSRPNIRFVTPKTEAQASAERIAPCTGIAGAQSCQDGQSHPRLLVGIQYHKRIYPSTTVARRRLQMSLMISMEL